MSIPDGKVMYHGERFNSISHLVGAALALIGMVLLWRVDVEAAQASRQQWNIHAEAEAEAG